MACFPGLLATRTTKKVYFTAEDGHFVTRKQDGRRLDQSLMRLTNSYPGLPFFRQIVDLSSLPSSKTCRQVNILQTKTILSRGGSRKLSNSSLMAKLIRIEWASAIRLPTKLMDVTSSTSKNGDWLNENLARRIFLTLLQHCTDQLYVRPPVQSILNRSYRFILKDIGT